MTEESNPRDPNRWDNRYRSNDIPWDTGVPDPHLRKMIEEYEPRRGRAIDIGCGSGTNALYLQELGFNVLGVDFSSTAINVAKAKAADHGAACEFRVADFLLETFDPKTYTFAYDRGCFHVITDLGERQRFVERVQSILCQGGMWHSLLGSTEGPDRDFGPPRLSAMEVMNAVEPFLEICRLDSVYFDDGKHRDIKAWSLVARVR